MAKVKSVSIGGFSIGDLKKKIQDINPFAENINVSKVAYTSEFIHTGNYLFNALLTGSLFKGIPSNKITTFSGISGAGKSFLALNASREAQKNGYEILYFDTEGAIDKDMTEKLGIDGSKFIHIPCSDLVQLKQITANIIQPLIEQKQKGNEIPKMMFVLDSLGMMASSKELADALSGSDKADFTKAKLVRGLFRLLSNDLANLNIPMIVTNHTVTDIGSMFPQFVMSGGQGLVYATSITVSLTKSKLKDDKADATSQTGIIVTAKTEKNRFAKVGKVQFHIHFSKGMNAYVGLENFIDWETCGIAKGTILTDKDKQKLSEKEQEKCSAFMNDENKSVWFQPKETSRNYVCEHLGRAVSIGEFLSSKVFTQDVLKKIDETKIKPQFFLGSDSLPEEDFDFLDSTEEEIEE